MLIAQNRNKLLTCLMIAGSILIIGCDLQQENRLPEQMLPAERQATQLPEVEQFKGPHKGVSLSPRSFQSDDFTDFFLKAKQTGEIVMWAGDWIKLNDVEGNAPRVTVELAPVYNYIPLIEVQFFTQSSGALVRPLDETTRQTYLVSAVNFAQKYKPQYLGLGIEVNILYEKSPEDFYGFVRFFDDVYGAIKATSPNTKVFTVFQLEKMKGLQGGLFGGTNDSSNTQWQLLDSFPKSDLVAFSTYPDTPSYQNPCRGYGSRWVRLSWLSLSQEEIKEDWKTLALHLAFPKGYDVNPKREDQFRQDTPSACDGEFICCSSNKHIL